MQYDAKQPRLVSQRQITAENKTREELNGELRKREIAKVSLPKFSWEKKDDNRD
jgi:hypothetical protein